jgi:hypothetical protein
MNYENLQKYIENLYFETPETVHGISLGYKIKDGVITDKLCISFFVPQKLEEKDLQNQYIVPKSIFIDGIEYLTDVVESKMPVAIGCFNWQASPLPSEILPHRSRQRPLKGGIIISNFTDLYNSVRNSIVKGTLGLICVDRDTDSFVGLTNAHVIVKDPFVPSNQDVKGVFSNILPDKKIIQYTEPNINVTNDDIGNIRKFYPLSKSASNYIDAALISIKQFVNNTSTPILSQTESWRQLGLNYNNPMEFASTQEINSLLISPREIYSAGRTTGPKGPLCPLQITNLLSSYSIIYEEQGTNVSVPFSNCITFKYQDNSLWSTAPGDSGSILIANFNGVWKIIGLIFAGDSIGTFGVACRIDTIAEKLNIEPWLNGNKNYIQNYKTVLRNFDEIVPLMSNNNSNLWNVTQTISGDKYWYAGLLSDSSSSSSSSNLTPTPQATITNITSSGFRINWTLSNGATNHQINISLNSGFNPLLTNGTVPNPINNATYTSFLPNTVHYVRVRGNDSINNLTSLWSPTVSATTLPLSSSSSSSNPPIFNTSCTPCCPAFTGSWAGGINGLGILRNCTSELYVCPTGCSIKNLNTNFSATAGDPSLIFMSTLDGSAYKRAYIQGVDSGVSIGAPVWTNIHNTLVLWDGEQDGTTFQDGDTVRFSGGVLGDWDGGRLIQGIDYKVAVIPEKCAPPSNYLNSQALAIQCEYSPITDPSCFDICSGGLINYTVEALYLHSYDPSKPPESISICSGTEITGTNSIRILTPYSPSNFIPQNAPDFSGIAILPSLQGFPLNVNISAILKPGGTPLIDLSNDNITFGQNTTITIPANSLSGLFVVRITGVLPPDNPNVPGFNDPAEIFLEASATGVPPYSPSLTLLTIYPGESGTGNGAPCGGPGHVCNRALFEIIIGTGLDPVTSGVNGVVVLNANLNNAGGPTDPGPGPAPYNGQYDRYSSGIITEQMAQQIFGASYNDGLEKSYFVEIKPGSGNNNPHNGITNVRIRDCSGLLVYNCCLSIGGGTTLPPPLPTPSTTSSAAFDEILSSLIDDVI